MFDDNKELNDQLAKMRRDAEERDAKIRANTFGIPYLPPQKISINLEALAYLKKQEAIESRLAIIEKKDNKLAVVAEDPGYSKTKQELEKLEQKGFAVNIFLVSESSFNYVLGYYQYTPKKRRAISGEVEVGEVFENEKEEKEYLNTIEKIKKEIIKSSKSGKISELVEIILLGAVKNNSSDIHFEPSENKTKIRYRIDGVLNDIFEDLEPRTYGLVLSRLKLLSQLKLNVKDEPQDGRFTIALMNKDIEVRVAIAPAEFGEVVVMRLLDPDAISVELESLGFRNDDLEIIKKELKKPNGMLLNTGPTGSGKTTTLYAFLKHKKNPGIKIITIEDPIEYHLEGIEQTQVDNEANYTFASGLRSLMRQDPDVILVGEIRDKETSEIAVQASLTGHLVFSTVHANSSIAAIPRILDLGVRSASLAPALNLIIAQRLVRKICENCKKEKELTAEEKEKFKNYIEKMPEKIEKEKYISQIKLFEPVGCEKCNQKGYKGRTAIFELLQITENLQSLIIKDVGQLEIEKQMEKEDFVSLKQDGVLKIVSGITTLEEVENAAGEIEF